MRALNYFSPLLIVTVLALSCEQQSRQKFDFGKTVNNTYSNSFFNFRLKIPTGLHYESGIHSFRSMESVQSIDGIQKSNGSNSDWNNDIENAELLTVFLYAKNHKIAYNPNFVLIAENLEKAPHIKSGKDYLEQSRSLLLEKKEYEFIDNSIKKVVLNNKAYYEMKSIISYKGITFNQVYYSSIINGYCLNAVISFQDQKEKEKLLKILTSMKFE